MDDQQPKKTPGQASLWNNRRFQVVLGLLALIGGSSFLGWITIQTAFESTGDQHYCGGCHEMTPIRRAYLASEHGGTHKSVAARCDQCHLDHSSSFAHFTSKMETGIVDVWSHITKDPSKIDWESKRQEREKFVFDSGCLTCHKDLEISSASNHKAFVAHKPYFLHRVKRKCVSCHPHVGHRDLSSHLTAFYGEKR